jgi:hypothetical protein
MKDTYEVKGSVHTLEQRKPWKHGLDDLPNFDNFDVEFSPAGKILKETQYTNAAAVHRTRRFTYDETGRLARAVELDGRAIEVTVSEYETFQGRRECTTRNAAGVITGHNVDQYEGDLLTLSGTYDASGLPKCLEFFEYAERNLSRSVMKSFGAEGNLLEVSISHFDSQGRIIETYGLTPDGRPLGDGRFVFEYDRDGRRHQILSYSEFRDVEIPNRITGFVYTCDERGNWIERSEYHRFRSNPDWTRRITTRRLSYYSMDGREPV